MHAPIRLDRPIRPVVMTALRSGLAVVAAMGAGVIDLVRQALVATGGVERVYWRDELLGSNATADPFLDAWRLSVSSARSGDFIVIPRRNWVFQMTGTTHGSVYEYDRRVPVIFFGAGIRAGRYSSAATPADIAPTLAALVGIRLPHADGWVLPEVVRR